MKKIKQGQTIVEPLISIALVALVFVILILTLKNLLLVRVKTRYKIQAARLAQEGMEVCYNLAVNTSSWDSFKALASETNTYYPIINPVTGVYELKEGIGIEPRFTKTIRINRAVRKKSDGNISNPYDPTDLVNNAKDEDTLLVKSIVEWIEEGRNQKIEYQTFLIDF